MAVYLDTSILVPLFFREPASERALDRIAVERELWLSRWALTEFSSAMSFKIRFGQCSEAIAADAIRLLEEKLSQGYFCLAELERDDFATAGRLCRAPQSGLRTADALHAAIALRLALPLLTGDKRQADGCRYHAIACEYLAPAV